MKFSKKLILCGTVLICGILLNGCQTQKSVIPEDAVMISLDDSKITVNEEKISTDSETAVYAANDIVFYLEGQDFTYGEGEESDEHSQEEADKHTVVHITEPGTYALSGSLSAGQIAIDLGDDAKEDPEAVVTLILNGVDINCSVAPGVIFYNVYECGSDDTEKASETVDTTAAGANVIIADGTTNTVNGSYVARIYETYTLNEEGTEVVDSEKLHKYDGAFYSKRSMNVSGEEEGTGILNITAENEGLDSEMHLTINGGNINITSGNDGINTNEDEISVTTINDGNLNILVNGSTGEGDGIDSNGWLVINGGTVTAQACSKSADAGIDSDMGIHINGGTVLASGNMLDRLEDGGQTYAVFSFAASQTDSNTYTLKNAEEKSVFEYTADNDFTSLVVSTPDLIEGDYTLWCNDEQLSGSAGMGGMMGGTGKGEAPEKSEGERPEMPEGEVPEMPEGMEKSEGDTPEMPKGEAPEMPEGMEKPDGEAPKMPEGEAPEMPEGMEKPDGEAPEMTSREASTTFTIQTGSNMFMVGSSSEQGNSKI